MMQSNTLLLLMLFMKQILAAAVAQLQFNGTNPSGNCTAIDDGSREGYHSPFPNTYLPAVTILSNMNYGECL